MKVLKFSASWCQPCKMLAKTLEGMEVPYEITEIDIDDQPEQAGKYQVRGVPTMVLVDDKGAVVSRLVGLQTAVKIGEWLGE
jgi:thioredoxin 1|tara:strand:- start:374 stop:619 length:246 start_codon:yes stop_codon:yes gene_type:complete